MSKINRALMLLPALTLAGCGLYFDVADVPTLYAPTCPPPPTCVVVFVTITPTPTLTSTSTATPTVPLTPTLESAWVEGTARTNVRLRAGIGVDEKILSTIKVGEHVQIHKLMLNFDPYASSPYGIYLWGYVRMAGDEGWAALAEMSGWTVTKWYIEPAQPLFKDAGGYLP